jgi:hypothetical protein
MSEYDELVDPNLRITNDMKINYLQSACSRTQHLAQVKTPCDSQSLFTGQVHTYDQDIGLYQNAAASIDSTASLLKNNNASINNASINNASINNVEQMFGNQDPNEAPSSSYSVNSQATSDADDQQSLMMFYNKQFYCPKLDRVTFDKLSEEDEKDWDKFSDKGKATIINVVTNLARNVMQAPLMDRKLPRALPQLKNKVHNQSLKADGLQRIITPYSHVIPL